MIPLRTTLPPHATPVVNRTLVVANVFIFLAQLMMGAMTERVILTFGYIPARLVNPAAFQYGWWEVAITTLLSLHDALPIYRKSVV